MIKESDMENIRHLSDNKVEGDTTVPLNIRSTIIPYNKQRGLHQKLIPHKIHVGKIHRAGLEKDRHSFPLALTESLKMKG